MIIHDISRRRKMQHANTKSRMRQKKGDLYDLIVSLVNFQPSKR